MRTAVLRSATLALVAFAFAPGLVGCGVTEAADPESSEADIVEKLPAANARPVLDPAANAEEIAFVKKLNDYRVRTGYMTFDYERNRQVRAELEPLRLSIGLIKAARKHAEDMATRNVTPATHNDGGKADKNAQGKYLDAAVNAARNRINADYHLADCNPGDTPCGPSWGEDVSRVIDGTAATAWDLMKTGLIDNPNHEPFMELGAPTEAERPNMMAEYWSDIGIARVKGTNGTWYWTITYGWDDQQRNAGLSLDDSAAHSLLANGAFGLPFKDADGFDNYGKGAYNAPATWAKRDSGVKLWQLHAEGRGSVRPLIDFPVGDASRALQGVRIADSGELEGTSHAVQLAWAAPGVNYEVQAKTRKIGAEPFQQSLQLDFTDANFKRLGITTALAGTSPSWTTVKASATAPAGTVYARVVLLGGNDERNQSTYDWDDVRLRAW